MFRNHKLSSYSLNSVCAEFLGMQKEDVHHSIISELQQGTDEDRRRLAVYCIKDSYLVIRLMWKLAVLINYIEMARVCGVPLDYLLNRGQQIKVFSMLLRRCRAENLLVPNLAKHGNNEDVKFEGATVIEPKRAFYEEPIATLDFASLYPSIMQAYNLCYSTLISKTDAERQFPGGSGTAYKPSPQCVDGVHHFVTAQTRRGILPRILEDLLAARKRAKADMKKATDPMEKAVRCAASFLLRWRRHHTDTPSTRVATPRRRRRAVDSTPRPTRRSRTAGSWPSKFRPTPSTALRVPRWANCPVCRLPLLLLRMAELYSYERGSSSNRHTQ